MAKWKTSPVFTMQLSQIVPRVSLLLVEDKVVGKFRDKLSRLVLTALMISVTSQ